MTTTNIAPSHDPAAGEAALQRRLIVALDTPTVEEARQAVAELGESVSFYKIGMQLQFRGGLALAEELIADGKRIFLDAKLFDIGATVTKAVSDIAEMGAAFLTVHGDAPVVRAAVAGRGDAPLKILAVTVLTNVGPGDLEELGYGMPLEELVLFRARQALEAGADGVIASPREAEAIRAMAGDRLLIVTPGVRPEGAARDDQKRIANPAQAIRAGADYLVVGRPIVGASDRAAAAEEILAEMRAAIET